jgi:predicted NAD/FAD-dependent oxidoreductase
MAEHACAACAAIAEQAQDLRLRGVPLCADFNAPRKFWENGQGQGGVWLCGDYLNHPWVEGAVRCGEKVAARLAG